MSVSDDFATRLNTAGQAVGTDKPQLAATLAGSGLSTAEIGTVGGFASSLTLQAAQKLAFESGAKTNFTADEKNSIAAGGGQVDDEDSNDSRSWLEKAVDKAAGAVSDTGNFLIHNPVTKAVLWSGDELGNLAHYPFRLASSALDQGNNAEIDREMNAEGYDPDSTTSYLAFMWNKGESQFHSLDKARDAYGDDTVDTVIQQMQDPEQFQADLQKMDPAEAAAKNKLLNSEEYQKAYQAVDAQHISPGRDIARLITAGHTQNEAFHLLSGTLDAAYTWFADPTLVLGKASALVRGAEAVTGELQTATKLGKFGPSGITAKAVDTLTGGKYRAGLSSISDQAGIEKLLEVKDGQAVTKVGRGWQQYLADAKSLREADAAAKDSTLTAEARQKATAARAGIYRGMSNRYGPLMGMLDEINGSRVLAEGAAGKVDALATGATTANMVTKTAPIETMDDLASYLVSTNGLLRMGNGEAARRAIVLPGKLSYRAERTAAGDTRAAKKTSKWINYGKPAELLPDESEAGALESLSSAAQAGDAQAKLLDTSSFRSIKAARAKVERVNRRLTTLIPNVTHIDLQDPNSSRMVEQLGRVYLNKGDSARLASAYALGDVATRRGIVKGVIEQSMHASGITRSEAGLAFRDRFLGEVDGARQQYGLDGSSKIATPRGEVEAALVPSQLSNKVLIPSMREMNYLATKAAVHGWGARRGLNYAHALGQSQGMDNLMGVVKLGWITSAAGGFRNALDEIGNFAAYGIGREVMAGRVAFTKATKDLRAQRRAYSKEYQAMAATKGRALTDRELGFRLPGADQSHQDALTVLSRAENADAARAALPDQLAKRVTDAEQRRLDSRAFHLQATKDYEAGKAAGLDGDQLATLRDKMVSTSDERVRAEDALKQHQRNLDNIDGMRAKLEESLAGVPTVEAAQASVRAAKAELDKAIGLSTAIKHRIPLALRGAADTMNDVLIGSALGKAMTIFGKNFVIDDEKVKWASELVDRELAQTMRGGIYQAHQADSVLNDDAAMELHRAGLKARKYTFQSKGWGEVPTDGGAGLEAWAKRLQLQFDAGSPAHSWVQTVAALQKDGRLTTNDLAAARDSLRARIDEDDMKAFVDQAEVFHYWGGQPVGDNAALQAKAKDAWADKLSHDLVLSTIGHDPEGGLRTSQRLLDQLAHGDTPDASWLATQIDKADRPATTIGQAWAPFNPAHELGKMPSGYTQMMSKAYDKVVSDQIAALSRNPLVTALYMNARKATQPYEAKLIEAGWDEHSAAEVAKRMSLQHAETEALKHIDNPYVASQASLVTRNYAAFVRAQEDWLRRWGRTIADNPQVIRQAQLLIHGGTSAGLVEKNDQGDLTFTYPGSSLALGLFGKLFGIHGEENGAKVPLSGELTSQLTFLNPSLDNPIGFSGTPLISMPLKAITKFLGPDHAVLSASLDKAVNGDMGAGRAWYEQMLPGFANRILSGVLSDDPGSKFGAAYASTLANLEAAGQLDDPSLQTASGKARLQHAIATQVRNNLTATALFGFFLPAAPSLNPVTGEVAEGQQGNKADWAAHIEGLGSLKDEARQVFSQLPYEQALAWWTAVHPNELIYAQTGTSARTVAGTKGASAPATLRAATWMEQNTGFTTEYGGKGGVATYFLPQGKANTPDGEYSDVAYRAQLESGLRDYKSLDDYFDDIITSRGEAMYYAAKDKSEADIAAAQQAGQPSQVKALQAAWQDQKAELQQANPLLAEKFAAYAVGNAQTQGQMNQLAQMVEDNKPSTIKALGPNRRGVTALLSAYQQYQDQKATLGDRRGAAATKQRNALKDNYAATTAAVAAQFPDLADLVRGVFRLPD